MYSRRAATKENPRGNLTKQSGRSTENSSAETFVIWSFPSRIIPREESCQEVGVLSLFTACLRQNRPRTMNFTLKICAGTASDGRHVRV